MKTMKIIIPKDFEKRWLTGGPRLMADAKIENLSTRAMRFASGSAIAILLIIGAFFYCGIVVSGESAEHILIAGFLLGLMIAAAAGWGALRNHARCQLAEQALQESERKYQMVVAGAKDYAILMLGPLGEIRSWNPGAERMVGCTIEEVAGLNFSRF